MAAEQTQSPIDDAVDELAKAAKKFFKDLLQAQSQAASGASQTEQAQSE